MGVLLRGSVIRPRALLVLVGMVGVGLPLLLAGTTGSLAIPHNDAWSHSKIAQHFAATGELQLVGWNRASLVGQIVVLGPLGSSITIQQVFTALTAVLGLTASYLFLLPRLGHSRAAFGIACIAAVPEFGLLSTSYMSDMPAFACLAGALWLADKGLREQHHGWLLLALVLAVWGVTIREQALAAVVAVMLVGFVRLRQPRQRLVLLIGLAGTLAALAAFELYRRGLAYGDPPQVAFNVRQGARFSVATTFTLALYVSPAVAAVVRPWAWTLAGKTSGVVALALSLFWFFKTHGQVLLGNYLDANGAYAGASQGSRTVLSSHIVASLALVACLSLAGLVGHGVSGRVQVDSLMAIFLLAFTVGTVGQALIGQSVFARYLLPALPVVLKAILATPVTGAPAPMGAIRHVAPTLILVALATISTALTSNALAYDAARWHAARDAVASGIPAVSIDAGLEWDGYHAPGPADQRAVPSGHQSYFFSMFTTAQPCVTISGSRLQGRDPDATYSYRTFAWVGHAQLSLYRWACQKVAPYSPQQPQLNRRSPKNGA